MHASVTCSSRQVLTNVLLGRKHLTKGASYKSNVSKERSIMADGSLEELLEVHKSESIEELFAEVFKDLRECKKVWTT